MSGALWRDPDGRPYAWSFFCGEHGEVFVAAEVPAGAEGMEAVHRAGCGRPGSADVGYRWHRYDGTERRLIEARSIRVVALDEHGQPRGEPIPLASATITWSVG